MRGVEHFFTDATGIMVERGRFISDSDSTHRRNVVVLGRTIADGLFGIEDPLGKMIHIDGEVFEVIGLIEAREIFFGAPSENQFVLIPFGTFDKIYSEREKEFLQFLCLAGSPEDVEAGIQDTRELLRRRRHLASDAADNFAVFGSNQMLEIWTQASSGISLLLIGVASLGLLIGGIGVMNIMLVTVTERTREIGIRKSLGARRRDIMRQFLVEAATLSTLGAVIGILLGITIAKVIEWKTPLPAAIAPWSIVMATLLGTVVGIISGVYPAKRAAALDPIEALRKE